jgi:hypothetical protein
VVNVFPSGEDQELPHDVGTLWTLEHSGRTARCVLLSHYDTWEVRLLVDTDLLWSERCGVSHDVFSIAAQWKSRLGGRGWSKLDTAITASPDSSRTARPVAASHSQSGCG